MIERFKRWFGETHGTNFELFRHFAWRFFDSDLVVPDQWTNLLIKNCPFVALSFFLLTSPIYHKYKYFTSLPGPEPYQHAVRADELWLITASMSLIGLLTAIKWQSLFPDFRDYQTLGVLPVRPWPIFQAKFLALAAVASAATALLVAAPAVMFPVLSAGRWQTNPSVGVHTAVHGTVSGLACLFVFFALAGCQGILLSAIPQRHFSTIAAYVQGALVAVMLALFVGSFSIDPKVERWAMSPHHSLWLPPVWFLGLYQLLLGDWTPVFQILARQSLIGVAVAILMMISTYLVSYTRHRRLLLETGTRMAGGGNWGLRFTEWLLPDPRSQGVWRFFIATVARSGKHRVLLMGYLGLALTIALSGFSLETRFLQSNRSLATGFIYAHLVLFAFVFTGLRHMFSLPSELRANWVFQLTERDGRQEWHDAVDRFVFLAAAIPAVALPLPIETALLGWRAFAEAFLLSVAALLTYELAFADWCKLPFTCSYVPGKLPGILVAIFAMGTLAILQVLALILTAILFTPAAYVVAIAVLVAAIRWARGSRTSVQRDVRFQFDEEPDAVVRSLKLGR